MDFRLYFKSRQGELIGLLKELVKLESPTSDKKAVDACSAQAVARFRSLGAKITRLPQASVGDFHLIEWPPRAGAGGDDRILILTHIDTVWPVGRLVQMPFYIQGDKIYGPGVLDMKAGVVMAYAALRALSDLNRKPGKRIALFLNSSEEESCPEADDLIRAEARRASAVLCLEPALPGGGLKIQRKGRLVVRLESSGRAAHAGQPEKGVSAVEELIGQIRKLAALRSKDVSLNVGRIGGGEKANVVAEAAWAELDFRFWTTAQKQKILAAARTLSPVVRGAKTRATIAGATPPLERTAASDRLLAKAREAAAGLGLTLAAGRAGGGSDGSIAAGTGAAVLDGLGPDGDGIHAADEHCLLSSLLERAALLTEILARAGD
ncbi:MAG: M20 family metallopeptidase [Candidatus Aminicenantes bacterium]|nr:M20 family metallopeptidase [Candidatus Aminicenantes bacterium]